MYDFYLKHFSVFGEVLTSLERNGIKVDKQNHLRLAEERAREDKRRKEKIFLDWKDKPKNSFFSIGSPDS
jgi:DNA polymerase-1